MPAKKKPAQKKTVKPKSAIAAQFEDEPTTATSRFTAAFDLFSPSWRAVKKNLLPFFWLLLLPDLLFARPERSDQPFDHVANWVIGLMIVALIYRVLTLGARPYLALKAAQGKVIDTGEAFKQGLKYFWRLVGLYIITGILIIGGFILLIVPGVIMVRRYFLAQYFLVDQDLGVFEAMRQSAEATKGCTGAIWGVVGVQILLSVTSIIPLFGGLIALGLTTAYACAPALRYKEFKK